MKSFWFTTFPNHFKVFEMDDIGGYDFVCVFHPDQIIMIIIWDDGEKRAPVLEL